VGWQLLAVGVFLTANLASESYARYALVTAPGALPGGLYGAWLAWTYAPIVTTLGAVVGDLLGQQRLHLVVHASSLHRPEPGSTDHDAQGYGCAPRSTV
jgi:hypothetical protein